MNWGVVAIVLATLLGPVAAVQAQKWLERANEASRRRRQIFQTLMATRATRLSVAHVEALNAIPVEFYGPRNSELKTIVDDWHAYLTNLGTNTNLLDAANTAVLFQKRSELFVDLLFGISKFLGYSFSKVEIQQDFYHPQGHVDVEMEQAIIRKGVAKLLSGELTLPMSVKEFPVDADALEKQKDIQLLVEEWLRGDRAVKIEQG